MIGVPLVQIVDAALAEAVRHAGPWLACRPGCAECCIGPFPISVEDVQRLRDGLNAVEPAVAARILERARSFPVENADDVLCPALDPATLTCDLYAWRPLTCRTFGPPLHFRGEAIAVCELCFDGATPEQIAACEVEIDAFDPPVLDMTVASALTCPNE